MERIHFITTRELNLQLGKQCQLSNHAVRINQTLHYGYAEKHKPKSHMHVYAAKARSSSRPLCSST